MVTRKAQGGRLAATSIRRRSQRGAVFTSLASLAYDLEQLPPGARHIEKRKAAFSCDQHKTKKPMRCDFSPHWLIWLMTSSSCRLELDILKSARRRLAATSIRRRSQRGAVFTSLASSSYDLEQLPPGARHLEKRRAAVYRRPAYPNKPRRHIFISLAYSRSLNSPTYHKLP